MAIVYPFDHVWNWKNVCHSISTLRRKKKQITIETGIFYVSIEATCLKFAIAFAT